MLTNRSKSFWLLLAPALLALIVVLFIPLMTGSYYSLTDWNGNTVGNFVNFDNYIRAFQDQMFIDSLIFTAKFSIVSVILINVIALMLATLVTQKLGKWGRLYSVLFSLCQIL